MRLLDVEASVAEPYGYTAPAVDIFATAVAVLIMFFAAPPWKQVGLGDGCRCESCGIK